MKRLFQSFCLLALIVGGGAASAGQSLTLNSGKTVLLLDAGEIESPDGRALQLEYETALALDDRAALHKEADELWEKFVAEAERGGYRAAVITAHAKRPAAGVAAQVPFDTVYVKIAGAWRAKLTPTGAAVPFDKATVREIFDRSFAASLHNNFKAWQLFAARDWSATIADALSPDSVIKTYDVEQALSTAYEAYANASDKRLRYEILSVAVDAKAGRARVQSRWFETITLNSMVIKTVVRSTDVMELRDGRPLWTESRALLEDLAQYDAETGRRI